jgi:Na+-translocating ferredoxin:NAD+ oxidoreductase RnfG subunit
MKKYFKLIIVMLIFVLCVGGLTIRKKQIMHDRLENQVSLFEEELYNIVLNSEEAIDDMDTVTLKECRDRLEILQDDIQFASDKARDETVIAM